MTPKTALSPIVILEASNLAHLLTKSTEIQDFDWPKLKRHLDNVPVSTKFRQVFSHLQDAIYELEKLAKNRSGAKGVHTILAEFREAKRSATEVFLDAKENSQLHRLEAIKMMLFCGILANFESDNAMESSLQRSMNLLYADADLSRMMDGGFTEEAQWFENELRLIAVNVFRTIQSRRQPHIRVLTSDTPNINEVLGQCAKFMHTNPWLNVGGRLVKVFEHTRGCTPLTGGKVLLKTIEHTYKAVDIVTEEIWPIMNLLQPGVNCYGLRALDSVVFAHEGYAIAKKDVRQIGNAKIDIVKTGIISKAHFPK